MNVAIAPASSLATSRTATSSDSGSSESLNAPPETGGITATSSPSAQRRRALDVLLVERVEQARRLLAELERGPHVAHRRAVRKLEPALANTRLLAQRANNLTETRMPLSLACGLLRRPLTCYTCVK